MNLLVLSPHRDDAALSLSISIVHWLARGHRVTLLNIFTRSLYAPFSDADLVQENDRLSYVSAMRKKEDESFLKRLPGLIMIDLNLKDAPIRLRCTSETVCDALPSPDDTATPKIYKAIAAQIQPPRSVGGLVLPLALGHHVDHCITRDAALRFAATFPVAFYEDLPYAARDGVQADFDRFRDNAKIRLHPVLVRGNQENPVAFKLKMATLYASQIDLHTVETVAHFSDRYQGAERLWSNELWLSLAVANNLSIPQHDEEARPLP